MEFNDILFGLFGLAFSAVGTWMIQAQRQRLLQEQLAERNRQLAKAEEQFII